MTRRRKEPEASQLLRFIAEYESLAVVGDEYPDMSEDRLRTMLREAADALSGGPPNKKKREKKPSRDGLKVQVFTDGAARGNPGPAGAGWIIRDESGDEVIHEGGVFLGRRTNNEAEYEAVIHSLQAAVKLGAVDVALRSDSELLVRQINGQYRVRDAKLTKLHRAARELIQHFRRFEARHIPRTDNGEADAQANRAIDEANG